MNALEAYRGVPVLVLGATGFIGRWVARALAEAGAEVSCAVREPDAARRVFRGVRVSVEVTDLADPQAVEALWQRTRPACVFNLAGYGVDRSERDEQLAQRINADLVRQLVELTQSSGSEWPGARLVHAGSVLEVGPVALDVPLREDAPTHPNTWYGRTKLQGTSVIMGDVTHRSVSARLFTVYGPGEHATRLLPTLLQAAAGEGVVRLSAGLQRRDFTFVGDVVRALMMLGLHVGPLPGVVHVATGRLTSVREFVEIAGDVLGIARSRLQFGTVETRSDETPHGPVDTGLIREVLGWVPDTPIALGVEMSSRGVVPGA